MKFTIKKLAKAAGVSERTLRHYHSIGLLEPAHRGENGYRYYGQAELERLQRILFYRELDFPLAQIGPLLEEISPSEALKDHRKRLQRGLERHQTLIRTIDATLASWERNQVMKPQDYFKGFDPSRQEDYENELRERFPDQAPDLIAQSVSNTKHWSEDRTESVRKKLHALHVRLVEGIKAGLAPDSPEITQSMEEHFDLVSLYYEPTPEVYRGLGDLYVTHPGFRKTFEGYHPDLAAFLKEAIVHFADKKWP